MFGNDEGNGGFMDTLANFAGGYIAGYVGTKLLNQVRDQTAAKRQASEQERMMQQQQSGQIPNQGNHPYYGGNVQRFLDDPSVGNDFQGNGYQKSDGDYNF